MYLHLGVANVYNAKFSGKVPYLAVLLPKLGPLPQVFDPLTQLNNAGSPSGDPAAQRFGKGVRTVSYTDAALPNYGPERVYRF